MKVTPPKWADKFLAWYCNPELLEEIQGDVYELFEKRLEQNTARAKRLFVWDVIRFFRWSTIKRTTTQNNYLNNTIMLGNYFKTGYRNLLKDKVTTTISVLGLSLAVGCAITTFFCIDYFIGMDAFHLNKERIYQVINVVNDNGHHQKYSDVPITLESKLRDIADVEKVTRIEYGNGNMRYEDNVFSEFIHFVDPDFKEIFSFPTKQMEPDALSEKSKIIISDRIAQKYFGQTNPIGKQVSIKFKDDKILAFQIGGVLDKTPPRHSFNPNVIISIDVFKELRPEEYESLSYDTDAIFVMVHDGAGPTAANDILKATVEEQNNVQANKKVISSSLLSYNHVLDINYEIVGSIMGGGHPAGRIALGVTSILLLLLACSNYINISVSSASKRLKEIAMRKVLGGSRGMIMRQFIIENILVCLIAVIIGTFLSYFFLLPGFNMAMPVEIPFSSYNMLNNVLLYAGLLIGLGLLSGLYPALFISKFQPISIFRGSQKFGRKSWLSRILLTFQFVIAFFTIVGSFVFTDASLQLANADWGYTPNDIISTPTVKNSTSEALYNKIVSNSSVQQAAKSFGHIGPYNPLISARYGETTVQTNSYEIDHNYVDVMGLEILEGRPFNEKGDYQKIIINEKLVRKMGWDAPLREHLVIDSTRYDVIGVVKDVVISDYYGGMSPMLFKPLHDKEPNYITFKTQENASMKAMSDLKGYWKELAPDDPFDGFYQAKIMDSFFDENQMNMLIISFLAVVTLIIASIGLYGLVAYNISRRMKEFSIRKVLGANLFYIIKLINKEYMWLLVVALIIGAPFGVYMMNQLIASVYPDTTQMTAYPVIVAILIIMLSFIITVARQVYKVGKANPVNNLRGD
ncbi:ABC transporter permease [Fulvivirga lutea]|uniref:ABC transporter permease n=1 Tax=Fulvivirga lutea TaxID=2810512 RepID=A0A974WET1_9BACT|nr:ABC transporter permease [Fulvivirga lutea]QSE96570.1 ABC transporter permease [Fulvivirga lutea]